MTGTVAGARAGMKVVVHLESAQHENEKRALLEAEMTDLLKVYNCHKLRIHFINSLTSISLKML